MLGSGRAARRRGVGGTGVLGVGVVGILLVGSTVVLLGDRGVRGDVWTAVALLMLVGRGLTLLIGRVRVCLV